jgi:RNA polymerase I-specific transcription initiation factor RRN6
LEVVEALHQPAITFQDASEGMEAGIESLLDMTGENIIITQLRRQHAGEPLDSLVGFPFLREKFSDLWLAPVAESLSNEMQKARQIWIAELARDVFLSSYGVLVQNTRLFGKSSSEPDDESQFDDVFPSQSSQLPSSSQRIASSAAAARSSSAKDEADAAFRRLRLLAPSIEKGTLGSLKQPKILSYWPTERGVDTEDYVSSIAVATEERFSHAKRRLQKIEAKRKAQSEKFKRPDFMRQRLPPSDVLGKDHSSLGMDMGPRPVQAMSSQQRVPDSSQAAGLSGPSVIMSQPVPGAFGDRKTAKKGKRKSGFR